MSPTTSRSPRAARIVPLNYLAAAALAAAIAGPAAAAVKYTILDLGTLGGASSESDGHNTVNASGQVVGKSMFTGNIQQHAFRTAPNGVLDAAASVGTFPGGGTVAKGLGINDAGQVVGMGYVFGFSGEHHAFRTTATGKIDAASDIGTLGGRNSYANDINNAGQTVGASEWQMNNTGVHAFRTPAGQKISAADDLGTLGGSTSQAYAINDSGQVAGTSYLAGDQVFRAFRTTATGKVSDPGTDLGTLGGRHSDAKGINASGQVVGGSSLDFPGAHAFRTTATGKIDAASDLGVLPGGDSSYAFAINTAGQTVGYSTVTPSGGVQHAFFVDVTGPMLDLNDLIAADTGWVLNRAHGINDLGQIAGTGTIGGQAHAFLLTPVPAPPDPPVTNVPLPPGVAAGGLLAIAIGIHRRLRPLKTSSTGPARN